MTRDARTNWTLHLLGEWTPEVGEKVTRKEDAKPVRGDFELPPGVVGRVVSVSAYARRENEMFVKIVPRGATEQQIVWIDVGDARPLNPEER